MVNVPGLENAQPPCLAAVDKLVPGGREHVPNNDQFECLLGS